MTNKAGMLLFISDANGSGMFFVHLKDKNDKLGIWDRK